MEPIHTPDTPLPVPLLDRLKVHFSRRSRQISDWSRRYTRGRGGLILATVASVILSVPLIVNSVEGADLAAFTSNFRANSEWGFPLFFNWKFGADFLILGTAAQGIAGVLQHCDLSGARSLAIGWKIFPLLASILSAYLLGGIAAELGYKRPRRVTIVMLLNPSMLWVASAYGEEELLAAAAFLGAIYLAMRRRYVLAGLVTAAGIGFEYWPIAAALYVVMLAVGISKVRRQIVLRYGVGLLVGLLLVFMQFVANPSSVDNLSKTVTPVSSVGGAAVGPLFPLSIWIFGYKHWAYGHWLPIFALAVLVTVTLGIRRVRASAAEESQVNRTALATVAMTLILAVLLDPRSLAQFSVLLVVAFVVLAVTRGASLAHVVIPVLATATFVTFVSLQNAWGDISGVNSLKAWSPGSSQELTSVVMRLCVVATILVCAYMLGRRRLLGDENSPGSTWSRIELSAGPVLCVVVAALCAQPALWSGLFSGESGGVSTLPEVASLNSKPADIYVSSTGALLAGFPSNLAHTAATMRVRPEEVVAIGESPAPLESEYGVIQPFVVGVSTGSCQATASFTRVRSYGAQSIEWLDVWIKRSAVSSSGTLAVSVGSTTVHAGAYEVRSASWGIRPFAVSARLLRHFRSASITGACSVLQFDTAQRISAIPASGRAGLTLNGLIVPVQFSLQPDGDGVASGFSPTTLTAATSLGPSLRGMPDVGVSGLSLVWPSDPDWSSPIWLDVSGLAFLIAAGFGAGLACRKLLASLVQDDQN